MTILSTRFNQHVGIHNAAIHPLLKTKNLSDCVALFSTVTFSVMHSVCGKKKMLLMRTAEALTPGDKWHPLFKKSARSERMTGICFWVTGDHRVLSASAGRLVFATSVWRMWPRPPPIVWFRSCTVNTSAVQFGLGINSSALNQNK